VCIVVFIGPGGVRRKDIAMKTDARPLRTAVSLIGIAGLVAMLWVGAGAVPARAVALDGPVGEMHFTIAAPTVSRGDVSGRMRVVVWYPAAVGTAMAPDTVGPPGTPYFAEGVAGQDAVLAVSPAKFPLIVFSHGTGGTGDSYSWLGIALAAKGYVVAAVDHPGNNAIDRPETVQGMTLTWLRAGDLSLAIDAVLANAHFFNRIDTSRIGAAGHSLGGNTVLELAGARTDLAALHAYCTQKPDMQVCNGEASNAPGLSARAKALRESDPAYLAENANAGKSYRDPRVKAVLAISPALGPELTPQSLHAIAIPIEIIAGLSDNVVPVADNAVALASDIPGAQLHLLDRPIGHYTFLTQCTPIAQERLAIICSDSGPVRASAHRQAIALASTFFASSL
jgi:predicted dienelactone hydrolase